MANNNSKAKRTDFLKNINLTAIVAVVILVVSLVMGFSFWEKDEEKTPSEIVLEPIAKTLTNNETKYIMREYEGNVAIFNQDETLYKIYEVNVALLPEYDQKLLKNGIEIQGEDELRARIEDYTS